MLLASVSGIKFNDLDGDGVRDTISPVGAEPGLRGWTIYHDENENGALDAGEASDVTDAEGRYDFDFDAGDARGGPTSEVVREVPQAGWRPTTARGGSVTLSVRTLDSEVVNFGNTQLGLITGRKFNDVDGDGVLDAGTDRGLAGFTIFADRDDDGLLDPGEERDVTAADGSYSLAVPSSREPYAVREVDEPDWRQTTPGPQHAPGAHAVLIDQPAEARGGFDFGNTQRVLITGQTIHDVDGDGTRDPGDPAVPIRVIFLDLNDDGNFGFDEPSVITGADGRYSFSPEGGGPFVVRRSSIGLDLRQTAPGRDADFARRVFFPLGARGATAAGLDFLFTRHPLARGVAFLDANNDSTLDPGEAGIPGITIYHDANNNNALDAGEARVLTDADGAYELTLPAGPGSDQVTYTIREVLPDGWRQTSPREVDGEYHAPLSPGLTVSRLDFGNIPITPPPGPRVTQVFVDGPGLRTSLANNAQAFRTTAGIDLRFGYPVPAGVNQLRSIPWVGGVSSVAIRFDADVADEIRRADLTVRGIAAASHPTVEFFYDAATRTAAWLLGAVITNDKLRLLLSDDLVAGLDGEWSNGSATESYPSGDGLAGGDFDFRINVLAGDATQDGVINALDTAFIKQRLNRTAPNPGTTGATYSVFADLTADGSINALDLAAAKQRLNRRLPTGEPAATALLF